MRPLQLVYDQLPKEFTRQDLMRILKRHHRNLSAEDTLYRYKVQGIVQPSAKVNHYLKVR